MTWYEGGKKRYKSLKTTSHRIAKEMLAEFEYKHNNNQAVMVGGVAKILINIVTDEYFKQLDTRCTNSHHILSQKIRFNQFIKQQEIKFLSDITARKIDDYLHYRKKSGLKPATVKHDYTVLKAFLNWCKKRNYVSDNITDQIEPPKIARQLPKYLSPDQASDLMAYITSDSYNIPHRGTPVKYYIFVVLFTGVRFRKELLRIKKQDIDIAQCVMRVHETKSGKPKIIPISEMLISLLKPLIDTRKDNERLFPVSQFPRKQWAMLCNVLDIDITPYQLKHTFATNYYMQTKDMLGLQQILGHADPATTKIYTQVVDENLRQNIKQFAY